AWPSRVRPYGSLGEALSLAPPRGEESIQTRLVRPGRHEASVQPLMPLGTAVHPSIAYSIGFGPQGNQRPVTEALGVALEACSGCVRVTVPRFVNHVPS